MLIDEKVDETAVSADLHLVTQIRFLTDSTFIMRLDRRDLKFKPGQRIIVGPEGELDQREYSIYSGENDAFIEILVREVPYGNVTPRLKLCRPGNSLLVNGPFGSFGIEPYDLYTRKLVFIATGTGISPFHSLVKSYPGMDYTLIHGVRYASDSYGRNEYENRRYVLCTSGEKSDGRQGRVTRYLAQFKADPQMLFLLCGNGNMIYEVSHILRDKGISDDNILTERYF